MIVELSTTAIFGDLDGYFFGNFTDKASNIIWRYAAPCRPVADCNKTGELSQRRPRDAPNTWVPWKVSRVLTTHPATFPEICNGLLFRSILRMCVQHLKFVALPVH